MRKTTAFLAAFLFTASFAGSVWTVSAEETKETEKPAATASPSAEPSTVPTGATSAANAASPSASPAAAPSETAAAVPSAEPSAAPTEAPSAEPSAVPTETPSAEPTEVPSAEPSEEPKEEHAELKKFVKNLTENDDQANELMNKLLAHETTAADAVINFFSNKNYDDNEEGHKQFIADLCKYVYLNEDEFDREYPAKTPFFEFGMSKEYFLMRFVLSDIFNDFCTAEGIDRGSIPITENRDKNAQITGYVQRVYNKVLGRRADVDGLNSWTGEMNNNGKTAADVLAGFLNSDEFKKMNTSDEEYVTILFRMCRDREPDEEELKTFVESTLALGHTREAVLKKFVRSDEFTKYCEDRGITRGDINVGGWTTNADGFKSYIDPDSGLVHKGYTLVNGIPCYFDNDGTLRTDWSDLVDVIPDQVQVYSYSAMEKDITKLAQQYPSLVKIRSIGVTFDGRQIYDFIIGNTDADRELILETGMTAADTEKTRLFLADAENFLKNYRTGKVSDRTYEELFENACVHIIPMRNPDGISIAQFGLDGIRNSSQKQRIRSMSLINIKNSGSDMSLSDYLSSWKANGRGIDLDYNAGKGSGKAKTFPGAEGYPGEGTNTEAELIAFDNFIKAHESATVISFDDFKACLDKNSTSIPWFMYGSDADNTENTGKTESVTGTADSTENAGNTESTAITETTAPVEKTESKEALSALASEALGASAPEEKKLSSYVEHLYRKSFGRAPDAEGWKSWTDILESGASTPLEMVYMFTGSREMERRNVSDEEFVKILFRITGDREPSDEERNKYVELLKGGYSRLHVTSRILELGELEKTLEKFGLSAAKEGKEGWNDSPSGRYYVQNGMKIRNDLRNLDGFTFVFDKNGYLGDGTFDIGATTYFVKDGYIMPRNGTDWKKEVKAGNLRSDSGTAQRMNIPVDYQFLYTRTICTFGGVDKHVRESGCGATSASMVMRYLTGRDDEKFDPEYLFEWAYKNGEYYGYGLAESTLSKFLESAGLKSYWIDPDAAQITRALKAGHPVISLVREGYFTSSGHYIVLTGITRDGYVTVNDPNNSSMGRMEYRLSTVINQAKDFMICGIGSEEEMTPEEQKPEEKESENKESENKEQENKEPENKESENKEQENKAPENKESENKEQENKEPENKESENKEQENKEPENKESENKEQEKEEPVKQSGWSKNENGEVIYFDGETGKPVTGYTVINNINCYFDESGVLRTDWSNLGSFVDTSSALYTYEDMVGDVNALKEQYPSLVDVKTLAVTADGRPILDVVIGKGSRQIVVHGGCHAREYMGSMLVMNQTENLLKHYWDGSYSGRSYRDLLEDHQIHIIPMLNPDGITISQKGLDGIRSAELKAGIQEIYSKDLAGGVTSLGLSSYLRVWKANAKGVDINRNFPVPEWSYQDGVIGRPSCAKYGGPSAGSEIETKAVTDLVNSLSGCRAVISYHSTGPEIYWQYHQSGDFLTQCSNTANALSNITGYRLLYGQNSGGGCSNWVADVKKIFACTIEIGSGSSPVDLGQYSGIWNSNRDVIPYMLSAY